MTGYGGSMGAGFPAILNAWGEESRRKPALGENREFHRVELNVWRISLMPQAAHENAKHLENTRCV